MHSKAELDAVGNAVALLVRKAEEYHARMEHHAPKEDPDAKKRAKDELDHARTIEKAVSAASEHFAKVEAEEAKAAAAALKAAEKAEEKADAAAEKKAEHAAHPHPHPHK